MGVVSAMNEVAPVGVRAKWPLRCPSIHECMLSRPDGVIRRVSSPLAAASREPHHDLEGVEDGAPPEVWRLPDPQSSPDALAGYVRSERRAWVRRSVAYGACGRLLAGGPE
jgi:hypothetical protein